MRYHLHDGHPDDGWVPEMDHASGARGSQYHPRLGAIILARLGKGETIKKICADADMPSAATLHRWRHVHPEFGGRYEQTMDERAEHRRLHARLKRERWLEWAAIEAKLGRRRTRTWVSGQRSTYERGWAERFCARVAKGEAVDWLAFQAEMVADEALARLSSRAAFAAIKRRVARIEGRAGVLAARTYR